MFKKDILYQVLVSVFIISGLLCQSCKQPDSKNEPEIFKGSIDLSEWNFDEDGVVKLNGNWEFYWNTFLSDSLNYISEDLAKDEMYIPGLWNYKKIEGNEISGQGYASYRLKLKLSSTEELAIKYLNSATSCEIFIDGKSVFSAGKPGKTIYQTIPSYQPAIIAFIPTGNSVEIILQIANYYHKKGGQWEPIVIGSKKQITKIRDKQVFIELLLIGAIFIMAIFHLLIFIKHRYDKPLLYFGIFAILIGTKFMVSGEFTIYMFFEPNWKNMVRTDYISFYMSVLFFMFFIRSLYPKIVHRFVSILITLFSVLFSISVFILPLKYFSFGMIYYQIITIFCGVYAFYVLIRATQKKREGAIYFLYAFIALFACMVYDILNENELIFSISLVPIGLTLFILFQALFISTRIRNALTSNQLLFNEITLQNIEYASLTEKYKVQNKNLKQAKDKAEESDRFKSAFLANISHEIRTPMNGILGFTGLLNNNDLSEEKRTRYLSILKERGHHLLGVINDIIDVSKIETGQIELHFEPTSINELNNDLFNNYKPFTDIKNVKLEMNNSLTGSESVVLTDKQKLKQILDNLISNSIKFTKEGVIEFGYKLNKNVLNFYVRDTGIGITETEIKIIFDRFNQANKSISQKFGGTGLGLSIVKAYVEKLNGQIWVDSIKGVGSTFNFNIPYSPQITSTIVQESNSQNLLIDRGLTLLLVEDNLTNAFLITEILAMKNISILQAPNGKEAINKFTNYESIDLVLLDIKLPDINGYDLIKKLKSIRDDVPFIAQTAYALKGDKEKAVKAGFDDYITKPINSKELIRKIYQHTSSLKTNL